MYALVQLDLIVVQHIEVDEIPLHDALPRTHGQELEIAAVIKREHLSAVEHSEIRIQVPLQRVAVFGGILDIDAL